MGAELLGIFEMTISVSLDRRIARVVRNHDRMRRKGVIRTVGADGLIRSRPRLVRPHVPVHGIVAIIILFFAFKALLFAQLGPNNYAVKIQDLRQGSIVEQAGAALMQEEILTVTLGGHLNRLFFRP